jgi:hypothetical protein
LRIVTIADCFTPFVKLDESDISELWKMMMEERDLDIIVRTYLVAMLSR